LAAIDALTGFRFIALEETGDQQRVDGSSGMTPAPVPRNFGQLSAAETAVRASTTSVATRSGFVCTMARRIL
jgi:hypothetical protein